MKLLKLAAGGLLALALTASQAAGQTELDLQGTPYRGETRAIETPIAMGAGALEAATFKSQVRFLIEDSLLNQSVSDHVVATGLVALSGDESVRQYSADIERYSHVNAVRTGAEVSEFASPSESFKYVGVIKDSGQYLEQKIRIGGNRWEDDPRFIRPKKLTIPPLSPFPLSKTVRAGTSTVFDLAGFPTRATIAGKTTYRDRESLVVDLKGIQTTDDDPVDLQGYAIIDIKTGLWLFADFWGQAGKTRTEGDFSGMRLIHSVAPKASWENHN